MCLPLIISPVRLPEGAGELLLGASKHSSAFLSFVLGQQRQSEEMPCPSGRTAVPLSSSQAASSEMNHKLAQDNHNVGGIDGGAPGQHVCVDQPLALAELKQQLHGVTDVCFCHNGDRLGLLNPLLDSFLQDLTVISIIMTVSNIIMK
jgi:hypothetical protein